MTDTRFKTGDGRPGFVLAGRPATLYVDSSWDGRGTTLLVRDEDVIEVREGDASRLNVVVVKDGATVLTGEAAFDAAFGEERGWS